MRWKEELAETRRRFDLLSFYGKFEQIVIFILTVLIAVFIVFAVWNLALKVFQSIVASTLDPTDYKVFPHRDPYRPSRHCPQTFDPGRVTGHQ